MGILLGDMIVRFKADITELTAGAAAAKGEISGFGDVAGLAGGLAVGALAAVGVAAVAVGVTATKMAADYQQSMIKVQALTGSSKAQMDEYDAGIKKLAVDAGVAPKALTEGLYGIISAGYSGSNALKLLTLATEDSKIGMTDATTASNGLLAVMNNFKVPVRDAAIANGEMLTTVTLGKAQFSDYATAIVKASNTSEQFHVSMETMNAAWATLTAQMIPAGQATTDYDQSLAVMYGNINAVAKSLAKNGIAFNEAKFNTEDYGHKILDMNAALQKANAEHLKITGVTLQAKTAISDIASHISMYNKDLATLSDRQAMAKKTQDDWAETQKGFNQSMSRLGAAVQVLLIDIGTPLLKTLASLADAVTPIVAAFTDWISSGKAASDTMGVLQPIIAKLSPILALIGNYIASSFLPVWQQLVETFNTQLKPAFDQIIAAIKPLLPLIGYLALGSIALLVIEIMVWIKVMAQLIIVVIKTFGDIVQIIGGALQAASGIIAFFYDLTGLRFNKLGGDLRNIFHGISDMIIGVWKGLADSAFGWAQTMIQQFIGGIQSMFGAVGSTMSSLVGFIGSFLPHSPAKQGELSHLNDYGPNLVRGITTGIDRSSPILAASLTHLVKPAGGLSSASAGGGTPSGGGSQTIIIELDSKQLSRTVLNQMDRHIRLKVGNRSTRIA